MKTRIITACLITSLAALFTLGAASAFADELDDLKKSFKDRYPALKKLKSAGKVGETTKGLIEPVKAEFANDSEVKKIVTAENADRTKLYQIIAKQQDTTPETVATRNAMRNFERAAKGDWLKRSDGKWVQKS